ncbi:hypothetical protein DUI87_23547 [Hirundo rustica rustica]|uniref:Transmembrane protein n=1 Tax=Hirundo rustica rustica TaxID=333673 RepID=A0A3M0JYX5_HIRRU|nr:hypothetical protein DUI87_23547 [Hirundo rustica rustica]
MALALRLLLLLLLAVALPARAAQAAPWREQGAAKPLGEGDMASQPTSKMEPLEVAEVMQGDNVLKAMFPRGSSGSKPASAAGREAMPGTVTGDQGAAVASPAAGMEDALEPFGAFADVLSEPGINTEDPVRLPRIFCPQDVRKSCMIGTVVTLFTVPLLLLCCYFGIRKLYEMRRPDEDARRVSVCVEDSVRSGSGILECCECVCVREENRQLGFSKRLRTLSSAVLIVREGVSHEQGEASDFCTTLV